VSIYASKYILIIGESKFGKGGEAPLATL